MTKKTEKPERSCDGCGREFVPSYGEGYSVEVPGAGGSIRVCFGRSRWRPSEVCISKAVAKAECCPACGKKFNGFVGQICGDCQASVARGNSIDAQQREWWKIYIKHLGPYLSASDDPAQRGLDFMRQVRPFDKLAALIVDAVTTGRTVKRRHEHPAEDVVGYAPSDKPIKGQLTHDNEAVYAELFKGQGQALVELCDYIRHVMRLEYHRGFRNGSDLLRRLAKGDVSVQKYDTERETEADNFADVEADR